MGLGGVRLSRMGLSGVRLSRMGLSGVRLRGLRLRRGLSRRFPCGRNLAVNGLEGARGLGDARVASEADVEFASLVFESARDKSSFLTDASGELGSSDDVGHIAARVGDRDRSKRGVVERDFLARAGVRANSSR